jgi:hypothetical protein
MTTTKKPRPLVFISEVVDDPTGKLGEAFKTVFGTEVIPFHFDNAINFNPMSIELPAARSCVGCRDEIPEGVYHGCGKIGAP